MTRTLELAKRLIEIPSVTPHDYGCQELLIDHLELLGFNIEKLPFEDVSNFYAQRGTEEPVFVFAGHTDVVPTGPEEKWSSPPFTPTIKDGKLYGRGAADMKSSVAAMITATENFLEKNPNHKGSIAFLITSDEEGKAINGTRKVIEHLQQQNKKLTWCLVGEASSEKTFGDVIKIGRRGTFSGDLTIHGKQGHIAYPQKADNPIHTFAATLKHLTEVKWCDGYQNFPATSWQISNINAGTGANNVTPGDLHLQFNYRFSPAVTADELKNKFEKILNDNNLKYTIEWAEPGMPFITEGGELIDATINSIKEIIGVDTKPSTHGGTSDGRFIAPTGAQVVELGPCNSTIHHIDENVPVDELEQLSKVYESILEKLLT